MPARRHRFALGAATALRLFAALGTICGAQPLVAPVAAAPAEETYASWTKTWVFDRDWWFDFDVKNGQLVATVYEATNSRGPGSDGLIKTSLDSSMLFDMTKSTPRRLVGVATPPDSTASEDVVLELSADGQSWSGFIKDGSECRPLSGRPVAQVGTPSPAPVWEQLVEDTKGIWNTPLGRLVIAGRNRDVFGEIRDATTGAVAYRFRLKDGSREIQEWQDTDAGEKRGYESGMTFLLSPDGRTLLVTARANKPAGNLLKWTATRYGTVDDTGSSSPSSDDVVTAPSSGGAGAPPGPAPLPQGDGTFRKLVKYDVRLDKVETPHDDKLVHVYLTLRNATKGPLYVTSGVLQLQLQDSDGATKQTGQVLRAVEGPLQHFASTPVVQPGVELKVQFALPLDQGASPTKVIVTEGDKRAEFAKTT